MKKWVLLLRGINVGGENILPMKDLKRILEAVGFSNPATYIQSGNCVFETDNPDPSEKTDDIQARIEKAFGFTPRLMFLSQTRLELALADSPFPQAFEDPKTLHFYFMTERPAAYDEGQLLAVKKDSEQIFLGDHVFYLFAPEGIGRSKLAAKVEKALGVPGTGRNLRTVLKIKAMMSDG